MIAGQHFIPLLEIKGSGDDIHAEGNIGDKNQVMRICTQEDGQLLTSWPEIFMKILDKKFHGLGFQLPLPALVSIKNRLWGRPEGAMIKENHLWIKQKLRLKVVHRVSL